jgi:hypothetical protein
VPGGVGEAAREEDGVPGGVGVALWEEQGSSPTRRRVSHRRKWAAHRRKWGGSTRGRAGLHADEGEGCREGDVAVGVRRRIR